jgi:hypothetical protein
MSFGPNVGCSGVMTGSVFLWCIPRYCNTVLIFVKCSVVLEWILCSKWSCENIVEYLFQVVTIATYSFFLAALVGRQYVEERSKSYQMEVDIYVPVFTILQFFFYMGLLKVSLLSIMKEGMPNVCVCNPLYLANEWSCFSPTFSIQ